LPEKKIALVLPTTM